MVISSQPGTKQFLSKCHRLLGSAVHPKLCAHTLSTGSWEISSPPTTSLTPSSLTSPSCLFNPDLTPAPTGRLDTFAAHPTNPIPTLNMSQHPPGHLALLCPHLQAAPPVPDLDIMLTSFSPHTPSYIPMSRNPSTSSRPTAPSIGSPLLSPSPGPTELSPPGLSPLQHLKMGSQETL